ncbi:hypothetical protein ACN28G_12985 [Micromonospora sp. WMMA1923]|uniref:hypothetical protein n=1 Tax=Micromonospora sp. WMMA1923 TaxID=3404125 RepID=UPI003B92E02B
MPTGADFQTRLALANADEVADLVAMRDLAVVRLLPALSAGRVVTGPTFEGSADLNADADLIVGGMLVDFKAGQGGRPRADGTRAAALSRTELDQLLGYVLLDYRDEYQLDTVAVYAARVSHLQAWPLADLCARLAGRAVDVRRSQGVRRCEYAKDRSLDQEAYRYGKPLTPVNVGKGLLPTSPAQVLHALGVATTLLTASPLAQVARHWAHVRYCATLTRTRQQRLALSTHANAVVYHHKVTQSEQLGIGLALVVARDVLRRQFPRWTFHAVDAEMALKAGRPQSSLMVASCLAQSGITAYALDPPGDDELWSGGNDHLDELLSINPEEQFWRPRPAAPDETRDREEPADAPPAATGTTPATSAADPAEELPPGAPQVFDVPAEQRGWFTRVLTRAVAATTLLFAGDSATASGYATPRQRGREEPELQPGLFELDPPWATSTAGTIPLPDGLSAEGTRYRAPLGRGRTLEVFRGVESSLYRHLAEGRVGPYLKGAPAVFGRRATARDGGVYSYGPDGTVLVVHLLHRGQ